jgi:hypothetical protein
MNSRASKPGEVCGLTTVTGGEWLVAATVGQFANCPTVGEREGVTCGGGELAAKSRWRVTSDECFPERKQGTGDGRQDRRTEAGDRRPEVKHGAWSRERGAGSCAEGGDLKSET